MDKVQKEWIDLEALENPCLAIFDYGTVATTKPSIEKGKRLIIVDCITEILSEFDYHNTINS